MLKTLDKKLKTIYEEHKNDTNPSVPVKTIRKYLELEGVFNNKKNGWITKFQVLSNEVDNL